MSQVFKVLESDLLEEGFQNAFLEAWKLEETLPQLVVEEDGGRLQLVKNGSDYMLIAILTFFRSEKTSVVYPRFFSNCIEDGVFKDEKKKILLNPNIENTKKIMLVLHKITSARKKAREVRDSEDTSLGLTPMREEEERTFKVEAEDFIYRPGVHTYLPLQMAQVIFHDSEAVLTKGKEPPIVKELFLLDFLKIAFDKKTAIRELKNCSEITQIFFKKNSIPSNTNFGKVAPLVNLISSVRSLPVSEKEHEEFENYLKDFVEGKDSFLKLAVVLTFRNNLDGEPSIEGIPIGIVTEAVKDLIGKESANSYIMGLSCIPLLRSISTIRELEGSMSKHISEFKTLRVNFLNLLVEMYKSASEYLSDEVDPFMFYSFMKSSYEGKLLDKVESARILKPPHNFFKSVRRNFYKMVDLH